MNKLWMGGFHRFKKSSDSGGIPKEIIDVIDPYTLCVCISFNRAGTLLAIGCNDGRLIIWDFITNTIARTFSGHTSTLVSLSWSQADKYICTGSADRNVIVWDIIAQKELCRCTDFVSNILKVQFHPRSKNHILISSWFESPTVFNLETKEYTPLVRNKNPSNELVLNGKFTHRIGLIASYSKRGKHILTGDSMGNIFVFDGNSLKFLVGFTWNTPAKPKVEDAPNLNNNNETSSSFKGKRGRKTMQQLKSQIKEFNFSTKSENDCFVVISCDRFIRLYTFIDIEALIEENKNTQIEQPVIYGDLNGKIIYNVKPSSEYYTSENYSYWITCKFSNDGKYIFAIGSNLNSIFIWSVKASEPRCVLTMDNLSDTVTDIAWHPLYSIICSLTNGQCNVWGKRIEESWCSYEPNFTQTDICVYYQETEGEFDRMNEDAIIKSNDDINDLHNEPIDIIGCNNSPPPFLSSDENSQQGNLCFLGHSSDCFDDI